VLNEGIIHFHARLTITVFFGATSLTLLRFWIFVLFFGMITEIADTIHPSARSVVEFDEEMVTSRSIISSKI
jgi:hypothetical protein